MRCPLPFFFGLLLIISCSDDDNNLVEACGVNNPTENIAWLRTEIQEREQNESEEVNFCYITYGEWRGQTVFIYYDCNPLVDKVFPVLNCEGEPLGTLGVEVDSGDIQDECVIWLPDEFACLISFSCIAPGVLD